jgi:rod shape-determining protein MreC
VIDANVIKNSYLNQRNILIIDKGHEDGITSEMGVISDQGIIGVVKSVSKNYSSVISILNQDLKINVRLKNSSAFGSLSWKGTNPNDFQIDDVVISSSVIKEDTIITGGMSSFFPLGIPLGKISNYEADIKSGYYKINASLFEDPSQVYYVYVVENFDIEEIKKIKKDILK